ncbi:MAG: hypothetical protein E7652_07625 [Ruminococcaceae bacterium]|nr:hypothetical protein [Oscillospiraceae bacterium]
MFGVSSLVVVMGAFGLFVGTIVLAVKRFYKSMYCGEGYLTFTLPVTESAHILTKLFTAVIFELFTGIVVFFGITIFTFEDGYAKAINNIGEFFSEVYKYLGASLILYIIELILIALFVMAVNLLIFYLCITVGQLSNKSRVGMSVLVYFIHYVAVNFIGTIILSFIIAGLGDRFYEWLEWFVQVHPIAFLHILFGAGVIICALIGFIYFTVIRVITKKKLNLE